MKEKQEEKMKLRVLFKNLRLCVIGEFSKRGTLVFINQLFQQFTVIC